MNGLIKAPLHDVVPTLKWIYVSDALVAMEKAMKRDGIETNDRQLACARISSEEGQDYLKGMAAAANFAWVNRSSMTFLSRQVRDDLKEKSIGMMRFYIAFRLNGLPRQLVHYLQLT